ncbi:unnamed protein product [Larinioides sclopetarius]|uniref:Uncharacterized protein n=1 Tax=Larinioides sclopetarius TaxID=280406 RepID=A0AAV1YY66_9ARAC
MDLIHVTSNTLSCDFSGSSHCATNTLPCEDKSLLTTELLGHMSPGINECGNQSEIHEIITNEVSSSELTAIVDSSECLNDFSPGCSAEGLKYLAGYIAHKCKKYDRSLAIPSGQILAINSKEKTWIEVLSRGGLLISTDEWFKQIKKFEETFIEMHDEKPKNTIGKTFDSSKKKKKTPDNSTIPESPSAIPSSSSTPIQPSDPPACETPKKASDESHQSRPRRTIIPPSYLKDYVIQEEGML